MTSKSGVLLVALVAAVVALTVGLSAQQGPANRGKSNQAPVRIAKVEKRQITEEQKANARDRVALATQIIDKHQAEAEARGVGGGWRQAQFETLLALPLSSLREVDMAPDLQTMVAVAAEVASLPQAVGSSTTDLVFTPIIPCRYIDTRNTVLGKVSGFRGYDLALSGSNYGGAGACAPATLFPGVGDDSLGALVMNVTVVSPSSAPGFLAVKPTQAAPLTSLLNWYQAGANVQVANQGTVTPDHGGVEEEFWIQTSAPTHVIVDLFGAFLAPEATALDVTTVEASRVVAVGGVFNFTASCPAGRTVTGGGVNYQFGSDYVDWYESSPYGSNAWICRGMNWTGEQITVYCRALCGRIPGR